MSIPASFPALTRGFLARSKKLGLNFLSGALDPRISFTRATPATVTDFEGLIKKVNSGEVRFDGMRRVENLLTYSQDFRNAAWGKNASTVAVSVFAAPDGTQTANKIQETAVTNYFAVISNPSGSFSTSYRWSCYAKAAERNFISINFSVAGVLGTWDLTTGVNNISGGNAAATNVGNGWWRLTVTFTTPISGANVLYHIVGPTSTNAAGLYAGVVGYGIYIWGAQLENVTGQTNQNPSEYISTNVLSYPYQGAGVDGVQYFPYTNPNCVINGAITTVPTVSINSSNSKFAYGCAAAGDYFSTPSSTANRITGNLSLLAQIALDDWTPTTVQCLIVKDGVSAGTRSWAFNVQTSGAPRLNYSLDGTNILSATATVATGFTDSTVHYVGVQREASTGIIKFYTSENGTTFTQLGADVAGTAGALFDATTQPVQFGNLSGLSFALDGKIYDSHVYNGLKFTGTSTMVMDFDPSNWTSGTTFTGLETGEVWTLNGNAKIYKGLWDAVGPSSLLIEEQRTNLLTYSSDFSNAAWGKTNTTITSAANITPDGAQTAGLLLDNSTNGGHIISQAGTTTAQTYTLSVYAKAYQLSNIMIYDYFDSKGTGFNLSTGTIFTVTGITQNTISSITSVGNGWYRCSITFTATAQTGLIAGIYTVSGTNFSYVGTGQGIYIWGAQLEAGSFATSYIPTTASQVTRNADQASMTGTNFSSWYNATAGTIYGEFDLLNATTNSMIPCSIDNNASNGYMIYKSLNVSNLYAYAGSNNALLLNGTTTANTLYKTSIAYGSTINATVNGATPSSIATGGLSGAIPNQLLIGKSFGGNQFSGHIRKINYYSTALPASVLQSLTL